MILTGKVVASKSLERRGFVSAMAIMTYTQKTVIRHKLHALNYTYIQQHLTVNTRIMI